MDSDSDSARSASPAAQLERALDVLELLSRSGAPLALGEIAERLKAPKPTVHRVLATLSARGYVTRDSRDSRYSAGLRCFELGSHWVQNLDLLSVARPHLARLNEGTGETVHLGVYDHGDVVYVEKLESRRPVIAQSSLGRRCPACCVSTGRALLAYQAQTEIDEVLSRPLPGFTARSTTDPGEMTELLQEVRRLGYAVNRGSYRDEVGGLAAPIRDHTGAVVAAVGVCLPEYRFGPDRFVSLVEATTGCAVGISISLGGPAAAVTSAPAPARDQVAG